MRTAHRIPVVGAVNSEQIVRNAAGIPWHERRSHNRGRPARCRVMIHCRHPAAIPEGHAHDLNGGRSRQSKRMSPARVQTILTGLPTALAARKDERLPLISGMDFENAVLFESQSVDWLQCERPGRLPSGLRSGRPRVAAGRAQIHEPPLRIVGAGSPMISE